MPNHNWSKVKEIFDAAIRRKPDERAGYLDEACVDDADVRREVESLLSSFGKADGFMEEPAVDLIAEAATVELQVLLAGQMIGRYEVVRKLGDGGMGAVYLAKDGKLGRNVAIKVLYKKYERYEENVRRFIREARAASALNHPNILTIHEIDEFEGSQYIVSEFVEGDTLRELLRKESLELNRIIDITKQIAGALGAAHKARIIHRDIKPENVIVRDDGYVKVLDFGLAKLLRTEDSTLSFEGSSGKPNETTKGVILGTVNYMSPEQAQGTTVDERTDVFSLGVVLYEMIAGSTPFAGDSIAETFANLIKNEPPPLGGFTSGLPDEMERIVAKMLSKDPELRYQTMGDCVADVKNVSISLGHDVPRTSDGEDQKTGVIPRSTGDHRKTTAETSGIYAPWYRRWPGIAAIAVLLMASVAGGLYWFRPDAGAKQTQIRSLAVLPLKSLDPNDNALGFGIADAVIRRISQTGEMTVRPASSVRQYLTEDTDAITAAKQLTVDAVLDGNIQRAGDRIRISVNLLKADGASLWTDSFDIRMTDVFTVQDTISQQVASRLRVRLNAAQQSRLTKRSTSNPIAYEYYTKGIYSYDQRGYGRAAKDQNDATIELFKKAIEADPNYALGHASLADAYAFQALHIVPGEQEKWISLAKDAINRADAIDPQLPETHLARSQVLFSHLSGYQAAAAIREVLTSQQLDPNIGHYAIAGLYNHIGLEDLAEREFQRAFEIDPTSKILASDYVSYYRLLHRPDEYLTAHQKHFPGEPVSPFYYIMKGDLVTAKQRIDEETAKNENRPNLFHTSFLLALKGEKKASEELAAKVMSDLDESASRSTNYHHRTYDIACIYAINGNVPESMKWLRDSAERGNPSYTLFARDPFLDKIRQSPEFIELMAELKLEYDKYRSEFH